MIQGIYHETIEMYKYVEIESVELAMHNNYLLHLKALDSIVTQLRIGDEQIQNKISFFYFQVYF